MERRAQLYKRSSFELHTNVTVRIGKTPSAMLTAMTAIADTAQTAIWTIIVHVTPPMSMEADDSAVNTTDTAGKLMMTAWRTK